MPRVGRKRRIFVAVLLIVGALFLARITPPERENISFPERIVRDIFAPFQSAATGLFDWIGNLPLYFGGINAVIAENEELKNEIVSLREQVANLASAYTENVRMKELLGIADEMSAWEPVSAKVISRSSDTWYNSITISGGENKGFKKDMAVITSNGLVGRIDSVSKYTSEVLLLLDTNCSVSAMIQESNTFGIVEAQDDSDQVLQMIHIPYDTYVEEGQVIITSGLGGIFPAGLRIGYIVGVASDAGGLMQKATVMPYTDFERLSDVLVLTKANSVQAEEENNEQEN